MKNIDFTFLRRHMVSTQLAQRGIADQRVLDAFTHVPRHLFVPQVARDSSYEDCPLPIGFDQTISQPYMVALMTQLLSLEPGMKVLEIGTGSGYQAAILADLGARVYSIERLPELAERARSLLMELGYNVEIKTADGTMGWSQQAPFDRIIVTAATPKIPPPLVEQLVVGGRLVIPVGGAFGQDLVVASLLGPSQVKEDRICGCIFVPLVGKYGYKE